MSTGTTGWIRLKGKGVSSPQPQSPATSKQLCGPPAPKTRKHAALKGNPTVPVSPEQWGNINQAIVRTVQLILKKNITLNGFGPCHWEMDEGLGVALVAEIRREIKETCTLADPRLQGKLIKMACDIAHREFRFPYRGGGVWFRFKMTNLQKAIQPIVILDNGVSPDSAQIAHGATRGEKDTPGPIDKLH